MSHHESVEFLSDQIRHFTAQDDPGSAQVCFQLVQSGFDLPSLVIQGGLFFGGSRLLNRR